MAERPIEIIWTDYMCYRAKLRGFDLDKIEYILRYSTEHYFDTVTERLIVVGRMDDLLVMIPYETTHGYVTPIIIHATTRQQLNLRLKTGRLAHE